jgi:hypothetical protein
MNKFGFASALITAALLAGSAEAIPTGEGEFKAIGNGAVIAPGTEIAIRPDASEAVLGNDPIYIAARESATQALTALGMRIVDRAALTLKLDVSAPGFGVEKEDDPRADSRLSSNAAAQQGPQRKPQVTNHLELPITEPALNGEPGVSTGLMLYDDRGRTLWSASFKTGGRVSEPEAMIRRMVRESLGSLGSRVERRYVLVCEKPGEVTPDGACLP